jgi:cytidylate kinase
MDDQDVTSEIRSEAISAAASTIAAIPQVRELMVELYRQQGRDGKVIIEGRDIGTVAFPDAELKIYLTASVETRAQRRLVQHGEANGSKDLQSIQDSIIMRDARDANRDTAPLARAADAIEVDTTRLSIDEVCAQVLELARQRLAGYAI